MGYAVFSKLTFFKFDLRIYIRFFSNFVLSFMFNVVASEATWHGDLISMRAIKVIQVLLTVCFLCSYVGFKESRMCRVAKFYIG